MKSSTNRHPEFETEQAFLHHAAHCLVELKASLQAMPVGAGNVKVSVALERMKAQALAEMSRDSTIAIGRIDKKDGESFHIGPRIIWDGSTPIVISWAAPIAGPFYTATPSRPEGLSLRRRLQTDHDRLLGVQDDIVRKSRAVSVARTTGGGKSVLEPSLTDALLDELGKERTGALRQMAATIQRDQYEIITRPSDSSTVIQGAPGTGKTIVGLHRAALLLYRNRLEGFEPKVLIVGPNPLFIRYISYVLPSLGETTVDQLAASELGSLPTRVADDPMVARVKGNPLMVQVIANAVADRVRPPDQAIAFQPAGWKFEVKVESVAQAIDAIRAQGLPHNVARESFRVAFERVVNRAFARVRGESNRGGETAIRGLPEFARAMDRIWPLLTPTELVRQLLNSEERLERSGAGILTAAELRVLYRKPEAPGAPIAWTTSDVPLVDEAQWVLQGTTARYWHVVLDEAQDLTPMELRMVGRRVSGTAITVLGDLAQATGGWNYERWGQILTHLGVDARNQVQELRYAYRVPIEIMKLAEPILKLTAPTVANAVSIRPGGTVSWLSAEPEVRSKRAVVAAVEASRSGGTPAIIAPRGELPRLREGLVVSRVHYGDAENSAILDTKIELLDPVMAKGLEFDHVVLVEPSALIRDAASTQGYRELYVALTRATRTLTCVYSEGLPWPLSDAVTAESSKDGRNVPPKRPAKRPGHAMGSKRRRGHGQSFRS
jgi:DNA helicase IV